MAVGIISPPKTKAQGASGLQNAAMVMGLVGGLADLSTSVKDWASKTPATTQPTMGEVQANETALQKSFDVDYMQKQLAQQRAKTSSMLMGAEKNPYDKWGTQGLTKVKAG